MYRALRHRTLGEITGAPDIGGQMLRGGMM
jgi:hypothetical protein